jgi:hypothetical protein
LKVLWVLDAVRSTTDLRGALLADEPLGADCMSDIDAAETLFWELVVFASKASSWP